MLRVWIHVCDYMPMLMCAYVCVSVWMYVNAYMCLCVYISECMPLKFMCICMSVWGYNHCFICAYVCMYLCKCMPQVFQCYGGRKHVSDALELELLEQLWTACLGAGNQRALNTEPSSLQPHTLLKELSRRLNDWGAGTRTNVWR